MPKYTQNLLFFKKNFFHIFEFVLNQPLPTIGPKFFCQNSFLPTVNEYFKKKFSENFFFEIFLKFSHFFMNLK